MHILYVAHQHDYGDPTRGLSFEHYNFYLSLHAMGHELTYFDYADEVRQHGKADANHRLEQLARTEQPQVLFSVLQDDQIHKRTIRRISEQTDTTTINWFCDDHWQFEGHARKLTPSFNHVVTTSQDALSRYSACGLTNVIKSQWGANHTLYKPVPGEMQYDVTFVGQPYGIRGEAIDALQRAGVRVNAWGSGWPNGKLDQAEMIRVFSRSRISLNFADASSSDRSWLENLAGSHRIRSMRDKPGLWRVWDLSQRLARWDKARTQHKTPPPRQIKGRVFEVPACGGFLLTQSAENLHTYLKPGRDCATFETVDDMVQQVRYYLKNEDERQTIASQGYQRTLAEHTYAARFASIFEQAGVTSVTPQTRKAA